MFEFEIDLDEALPPVNVNEFVIWEILEPLIQNSIDHGQKSSLNIKIQTKYDTASNTSYIFISDNGVGISPDFLEYSDNKIKKIFLESESTAKQYGIHSGYGCYIAYQMAVGRCGWLLDAENPEEGGCKFTITIKNR
jgi:signal transduction histidine kinase